MSSFHNVRFPLPLAFGASGGPRRQTEIVTLASGHEQRNTSQANSRRHYDAGVGIKRAADMAQLMSFFEARRGQLYGFRFRDPMDYSSALPGSNITATDQNIGTGDGVQTQFQLVKTYGDSESAWQRKITKPIAGSVLAALDGVQTSAFTTDSLSGVLTFNAPPENGAVITAGFEFDVPVRFDTDELSVAIESFGAGSAVSVPLTEIFHA